MGNAEKVLAKMREAPQNVRYSELAALCEYFFGKPRQQGTRSHFIH